MGCIHRTRTPKTVFFITVAASRAHLRAPSLPSRRHIEELARAAQVPWASAAAMATRTNLLPTTDRERTIGDTQRADFTKQTYEVEAEKLGIEASNSLPLTAKQGRFSDRCS